MNARQTHTARMLAAEQSSPGAVDRIVGTATGCENAGLLPVLRERAALRGMLPWQYLQALFDLEDRAAPRGGIRSMRVG